MKTLIEKVIRKSINDHLVRHVQIPADDKRCRVDILVDEATQAILKYFTEPMDSNAYNLFLDDFRIPWDAFVYSKDTDFLTKQWIIVRSHKEFCECIAARYAETKAWPAVISFDHDLADTHYEMKEFDYEEMEEKTGYHSAKWLVDFCLDNKLPLPAFKIHSQNPAGSANIKSYLENYKKHEEI